MSTTQKLIDSLQSKIGKIYVLGTNGPESYDCSGLVQSCFKEVYNIDLPRITTDQFAEGESISKEQLQPGDIVFFDTGWVDRKPNHNGVYIGNGKFINANSYNESVVEESLESNYWKPLFYGARRVVLSNNDSNTNNTNENNTPNNSIAEAGKLQFGDRDESIQTMQTLLDQYGYFIGEKELDGHFGEATKKAVIELQLTFEIIDSPQDTGAGIYEQETKSVLEHGTKPFQDTPLNHENTRYIRYLYNRNIVEGYAGQVFKPDQNINRAEALKIILSVFNVALSSDVALPYKDVHPTDWFYVFVQTAHTNNIVEGYQTPEGQFFRPANNITRAEALKVILETGNITTENIFNNPPSDVKNTDWFHHYVATALNHSMITTNNNQVSPNTFITRGDLCRAIVRASLWKHYSL